MRSTLRKLLARLPSLMGGEEGQDLVEYGLLCTLLSLSFIASAPGVSSAVNKVFTNVSNSLTQSQPSTDGGQGGSSGGGQGSGGQSGSGSGDTGSGDGGHHHHHGGGDGGHHGWGGWGHHGDGGGGN